MRTFSTSFPESPVRWLSAHEINLDPDRFQFRTGADDDSGTVREAPPEHFDATKCPPLLVWLDPADDKTYLVDGHHRYEWAERDGVKSLPCRFIQATTAEEAKRIGREQNASQLAAKRFREADPSAGFQVWDGGLLQFAEWRPYTNPRTQKSGWISTGGMVRYDDPRKKEEETAGKRADAEQALANALADPSKVTDEHLPRLRAHLDTMTHEKMKEFARSVREKIGKKKADLADRLVEKVRSAGGDRTGAALERGDNPTPRADLPGGDQSKPVAQPLTQKDVGNLAAMFWSAGVTRPAERFTEFYKNAGVPDAHAAEFMKRAEAAGILERVGENPNFNKYPHPTANEYWIADPSGPRLRVVADENDPKFQSVLSGMKNDFGRKFTNTPGTGEPVKLEHVGDASHPVAKALATDRHVQEVFAKIAPHLDAAKSVHADWKAKATVAREAMEKSLDFADRYNQLAEKYKDVTQNPRPRDGTKALANFEKREAKYHKEIESVSNEETEFNRTHLLPARDAAKEAKGKVDDAMMELAPKILDAIEPEKSIHVNGMFEPPAGKAWYENPHDANYKTAPVTSPATREEWGNAREFVQHVTGHQRKLDLIFGVSKSGRGFAHHDESGPSTVVVSTEAHDDVHSRRHARSVAIHEIGHEIEKASPGLVDDSKDFLDYRCGTEKAAKLNEQFPGGGYADWEMGRKDKFDKSFDAEGSSSPYYVGKIYPDATEVISMGIQQLHDDPARFAVQDPEYFAYMVRSLRRDS